MTDPVGDILKAEIQRLKQIVYLLEHDQIALKGNPDRLTELSLDLGEVEKNLQSHIARIIRNSKN